MADLHYLQRRLNEDENFRNEFLRDPNRLLEAEGVELSNQMRQDLAAAVEEARAPRAAAVGGAAPQAIAIEIRIVIRF